MVIVLTLLAFAALFVSLISFATSTTVIHEIFAGLGIICFVLCLGFAGVIEAVNRIYKDIKENTDKSKINTIRINTKNIIDLLEDIKKNTDKPHA